MAVENDLVLIYFEEKPLAIARIESAYIRGTEFTMNGKKIRLEKVESPVEPETSDLRENKEAKKQTIQNDKGAKVISLEDLKRK
ncbi:MAG: hypothetical protein P8185_23720 [Deltaproteobacteria bacterium]